MGSGFAKKKKQAKLMQEQFLKMQEDLKNQKIEGSAGNGLVKITLDGEGNMQKIAIKPDCVDPEDVEGLEDLILAAYQDASKKVQENSSSAMPNIPGLGGLSSLGF